MGDGCRARVLAVDDQPPFLAILRAVVGATGHLELAGEAQSGEEAVVAAHELRPDMVLMDVRMPGIGGLKAAERIKATHGRRRSWSSSPPRTPMSFRANRPPASR